MNEQLILRSSEIILSIAAILATATILLATWHDLRVMRKHKKTNANHPIPSAVVIDSTPITSIRTLPPIFAKLSNETVRKALAWHTTKIRDGGKRNNFLSCHNFTATLFASIGLLAYITILTYFFYTAATLRSSTLLTLSWTGVSLWLVAIVWSSEKISLAKKSGITFAVPFMYFVFYVLSFPRLIRCTIQTVKLATQLLTPRLQQLATEMQLELYSTRF